MPRVVMEVGRRAVPRPAGAGIVGAEDDVRATAGILFFLCAAAAVRAEEEVRLATDSALSPEGSTLVFAWRGALWRAPAAGGRIERLTSHPARESDPHFSPDGARIAFTSQRTGSDQAWLVDAAGGTPVQLSFHSEGSRVEGWFPGGEALLLRGARDHFWVDAGRFFFKRLDTTAAPVLLFDDAGYGGRVSQDGRRLLFVREGVAWWRKGYRGSQAAQVWSYDTASRRFERLSKGDHSELWPLWLPGGDSFLFVSDEDGTGNLWRHDLGTGARTQLTRFADDGVLWPAVSRDGRVSVFRRGFDLWRLDLKDGAEPVKLRLVHGGDRVHEETRRDTLTQATQVAFSDDGREIAFIAGGDVWVMDTELKEPVQVTNTPEE